MPTQVKGATINNSIAVFREFVGAPQFLDLADRCPPETQQLLRRTLVAVEWVPLEAWTPVLQIMLDHVCRKDEGLFRRLIRLVCKRDFSSTYRVYVNSTTPRTLLDKASNIWAIYFDTGSLRSSAVEIAAGQSQAVVALRELETNSSVFTIVVHAYLEQLIVMAGAERCVVQRSKEQLIFGRLSCDYLVQFSG